MTNNASTVSSIREETYLPPCTGMQEDFVVPRALPVDLSKLLSILRGSSWLTVTSSVNGSDAARVMEERSEVKTTGGPRQALLVSALGWSREEAQETYLRLRSFEEDWDAPGMEAYDDL